MEAPDGKIAAPDSPRSNPPRLLEALVRSLTPAAFRYVADDLAERYRGPLHYLNDAVQTLPYLTLRNAVRGRPARHMVILAWLALGAGALLAGAESIPLSPIARDIWVGFALMPALTAAFRSRPTLAAILLFPLPLSLCSLIAGNPLPARPFAFHLVALLTWILLLNRVEAGRLQGLAER